MPLRQKAATAQVLENISRPVRLSPAQQAASAQQYVAASQLETRLLKLRETARKSARAASLSGSLAAALVLPIIFFAIFIFAGMAWQFSLSDGQLPLQWIVLLEFTVLTIGCFVHSAMLCAEVFTTRKLFAYYYREAWRGLLHREDALLFAQESFLPALREELSKAQYIKIYLPPVGRLGLEQQLELCAMFFGNLRRMPREARYNYFSRYAASYAIHSQIFGRIFRLPLALWIGLQFVPLLGLIANSLAYTCAPQHIISRARLVAFIDFITEQPRIDISQLEPPQEPRGWWARQLAPWKCREKAPE